MLVIGLIGGAVSTLGLYIMANVRWWQHAYQRSGISAVVFSRKAGMYVTDDDKGRPVQPVRLLLK